MSRLEADLVAKNAKLKDRAASLERRRSALERANRTLVEQLEAARSLARTANEEANRERAAKIKLATQLANLNRTAAANLAPLLNRERRQTWASGYALGQLDQQGLTTTPNPYPEDTK